MLTQPGPQVVVLAHFDFEGVEVLGDFWGEFGGVEEEDGGGVEGDEEVGVEEGVVRDVGAAEVEDVCYCWVSFGCYSLNFRV